jgi:phosphoadenosine phosphosulfate reductase
MAGARVIDLLESIKSMAATVDEAVVFFSSGKDSICMLDLFQRFLPGRYVPVFLYFVKGLEFQERTLRYYEARFGIDIQRRPHWDIANYDRTAQNKQGRALKEHDIAAHIRDETGLSWLAYGYRTDESMQRRGQLRPLAPTFIDHKFNKLYPLGAWSRHHVEAYVKERRLVLPVEYQHGYRNIDQFKGRSVLWIRNNYPDDWLKIIERFPVVEAEAIRQEAKAEI